MELVVNGLKIEVIWNYDPLNRKANRAGMVKEWVGRNGWGNAVVFGDTKAECIANARNYRR